MPSSPPQVNAFLLCDQAFQQAFSGKWCIIGTFGVIWARAFPCEHSPLCVFIGLSDFTGPAGVKIVIRTPDGDELAAVQAQIPQIPMSIAEFMLPFPPIRFEKAGGYTLELLVNDSFLTARSFRVEQAPQQPGQGMPPQAPPGQAGGPPPMA